MSDVIRELGVLLGRPRAVGRHDEDDAFVEANRAEIISAAWDMSEILCKWRTLCAVFYHAHPRDKYDRVKVQPTPESEIRVFHAANSKKIVAEVDRLALLDPDMIAGFYAALDIVVQDAINNKEQAEA